MWTLWAGDSRQKCPLQQTLGLIKVRWESHWAPGMEALKEAVVPDDIADLSVMRSPRSFSIDTSLSSSWVSINRVPWVCALLGYSLPPFSCHFLPVLFNSEPQFPSWLVYLSRLWYSELKACGLFTKSYIMAADAAVHTWKGSLCITQLVPWRLWVSCCWEQISRCCCLLQVKQF